MINMNFNDFKKASEGYNMVPLSLEIEGDMDTPITLYKKLCNEENCFLLESVEGGSKWGRYSIIGRNPFIIIKSKGKNITIEKKGEFINTNGNVLDVVKDIIDKYKIENKKNMPDFIGGAVGYIGYDIIRDYEDLKNINHDDIDIPDVHLLFTKEVIVYDHIKQKIVIINNVEINEDLKILYDKAIEDLNSIRDEILNTSISIKPYKQKKSGDIEYTSNETKEDFMKKVIRAKEYIRDGDIFQVVLSQRFKVESDMDPFKAYRVLRSINPSPYMFFIDLGDYHVVGSSPELLVKLNNGIVETCPIAGTRKRGKDEYEDDELAKDLLGDEKERAEHIMLVDLGRNDIGKISKFGTVDVTTFMDIQKYSHVMHIVSNVVGEIDDDKDMFDALISCLPAGTVSGAPKVRAMEIIDELENNKRGLYAGAVGYLGFNGNMDTCIAIRTTVFKDNNIYIQAGAGIVADSDPESEYEETIKKANALFATLKKVEEE